MQAVSKFGYRFSARATLLVLTLITPSFLWAETHIVEMKKFKFVPEEITIKVGDTVRWVNTERRQFHTIWFKDLGEKETPEFFPDDSYEKTFDQVGTFAYLCGPHWEDRDMKGVVQVVE